MFNLLNSFLSLFVGFLGFLVVIFIVMSYKRSAFFNVYLLIIFVIIAFRLTHIGLLGFEDFNLLGSYNPYIGPLYLFGIPSIYLYFESLYKDTIHFTPKHLVHLVFPFANLVLNGLQHDFLIWTGSFIESVQAYSILGFVVSYLLAIIYSSYKNLWKKNGVSIPLSSVHESLMRKWTIFLLILVILLSFRLVYSIYTEIDGDSLILGYQGSLLKSTIWFFVFVKILMSPELLYGYPKLEARVYTPQAQPETKKLVIVGEVWNDTTSKINSAQDVKLNATIDDKIASYLAEIEDYVALKKPFRNNKYTIKDLSKALHIPVSHLAYVFKYHCEVSFVEYRNKYRIKDAVSYINSEFLETQTFDALADAVGFTSYNSFFVSFKKYTGVSPKDYLQNMSD